MKSVVFVTNSIGGGGAERVINLVASSLDGADLKTYLIPINQSSPDLITPSCKLVCLERNKNLGFIHTFKTLRRFKREIRKINPDFLVLNCDLPEFFGAVTKLRKNTQIISVEHTSKPWAHRKVFGMFIRLILIARGTKWIIVQNDLIVWPFRNIRKILINNPIPDLYIRSNRTSTFNDEIGQNRLIFIGRLTPEKNANTFIELCASTQTPGVIIGEGPEREKLEALATKLNAQIQFTGQKIDPWVLVTMNDLVLVTSDYEGDGLVIVEAILQNQAILVSSNIESGKFGLPDTFSCADFKDFLFKIQRFKKNPSQFRIPEFCVDKMKKERELTRAIEKWKSLLLTQTH